MLNHSSTRKANKDLRERIEKLCVSVKPVLQDADIDDTQLLTLTREDLNELFPGHRNFQLRKRIMELLTEEVQEPVGPGKSTLVNTLRNFIQRNDRGEPAAESIWKEYLCALRNVEKQLTAALDFLKSHIELMENLSEVPMQEAASSSEFTLYERYAERGNQNLHATSHCIHFSLPVKIHSVVCGNTLGAHDMILRHLQSVEHTSAEDCRVILVFCPIASRPGTDIEAAIRKVPVSKATILVVMHHTFDRDHAGVTSRLWSSNANVVECVNVIFHESEPRLLLECHANTQAISQIQSALQQFK